MVRSTASSLPSPAACPPPRIAAAVVLTATETPGPISRAIVPVLPWKASVVPYGAVLYSADGTTFTYTSPTPRVFVRAPITVARIDGDEVILRRGPPVGTQVVTVGSQELYGSEYEVEEG